MGVSGGEREWGHGCGAGLTLIAVMKTDNFSLVKM